jgi:hypothetical protein
LVATAGGAFGGRDIASIVLNRAWAGVSRDPRAFRTLLTETEAHSGNATFREWYVDEPIRMWIATNRSTPGDVLMAVALSRRDYPAYRARHNPSIPLAVLTDSLNDMTPVVEWAIAEPPQIQIATLDSLARRFPAVREGLGFHPD